MSRRKINLKDFMMKLGPLMALFFLCAILTAVTSGRFLTYINLMNIFKQTSVNCLIASGMLVVLITAGIDLSVGSNCVLAACVVGVLVQNFGVKNPLVLIIAALVTGLLAGVVNGLLLTRLNLPHPFISTLGMKNITLGLALLITSATPVGFFNTGIDPVLYLGSATIAGFPISFIVVVILFSGFHIFLNKTALGRQIYCVGGNPEAARLSGIRSKNVLTFVYGLSGFMCGIAAIVLIGRVSTANATAGTTFDTDAIAACIIGGASFNGGMGTIWGTLIGALIMGTIRNGLNLLGAQNDIQYIVIGAVIVLAVFIDVSRGRMEAKARRLAAM